MRIAPHQGQSLTELEAELALLIALDAQGFNVALPVLCQDDSHIQTLDAPEGPRHAVLFRAVPGMIGYPGPMRNRPRTKAEIRADKKRTGRPPKVPNEKQSEQVTVYLTPAERKRLEALAAADGMSLASFIMRPWRDKGE